MNTFTTHYYTIITFFISFQQVLDVLHHLTNPLSSEVEDWTLKQAGFEQAINGLLSILNNDALDPAFRALILTPPSTSELIDNMNNGVNPLHVHTARNIVIEQIAEAMHQDCQRVYEWCQPEHQTEYTWNPETVGKRALASRCLKYLMAMKNNASGIQLCRNQFQSATNMTDSFNALASMNGTDSSERNEMMSMFLQKWKNDPNVIVKYLLLESTTDIENNTERLRQIFEIGSDDTKSTVSSNDSIMEAAAAFDMTLPNKVYALCRAFSASVVNFHHPDGSGYTLMADMVIAVDKVNAQVGSRLAGPFTKWQKYDEGRRVLILKELERMMNSDLTANTREIVSKCLKQKGGESKL